jgi:hypothetical protein
MSVGWPAAHTNQSFSLNGHLLECCTFASDRNGWWNLQRISGDGEIETVYMTKV